MSAILQDTRHTLRQLSRHPAFIFTAVLTLAVGFGVNAVAFTVVNGILFKGPATTVGQGIGRIATIPGGDENGYASLDAYQRFSSATSGALDLAAEGRLSMALQQDPMTRTAWVLFVSRNYFSIVQAAPIAGRIDVSRPPGGVPSVGIGERFWRTTLQSGSIAGLTLRLNNELVNVAGDCRSRSQVRPASTRPTCGCRSTNSGTSGLRRRSQDATIGGCSFSAGCRRVSPPPKSRDVSKPPSRKWQENGLNRIAIAGLSFAC